MGVKTLKHVYSPAKSGPAPVSHVERQLLDTVERTTRSLGIRSALVLHLSRMPAPGPRPHHGRVARVILDDDAARRGGQVFALRNGDLVLLLPERDAAPDLLATLARLFRIDMPNPALLLSDWRVPEDGHALLAYASARAADAPPDPDPPGAPGSAVAIDAISGLIQHSRMSDLLQRQTAVLLGGTARMQPLFREVTFSLAVLEARIAAVGHAQADPFLFRHLASRLDGRMLEVLRQDLQADGPLTAGARDRSPALHLNLTLSGILSDAFAGFAASCRAVGASVGVEVSLMEACGDPEAFAAARDRLRLAGLSLVLDSVSHHALLLTVPLALAPDLVKLDWSPTLPEAGRALEDAVRALGSDRVVLHRAETETALAWGLARGIRRFQGRHVDAMLAAGRIGACAYGGGCSLQQCMERATATGPGGRAGCRNQTLLDAGAPMALA